MSMSVTTYQIPAKAELALTLMEVLNVSVPQGNEWTLVD